MSHTVWGQQSVITIDSTIQFPLNLSPYTTYYRYSQEAVSFKEMLNLPDSVFKPNNYERIVLGFTKDTVWFKTKIYSSTNSMNAVIQIGNSFSTKVELYHQKPDLTIELFHLGATVPMELREYEVDENLKSINLIQGEHIFYVKLASKAIIAPEYTLFESGHIFEYKTRSYYLFGLLIGILIFSMTYNLVIFKVIQEWHYIYFITSQFFYLIVVLVLSGYGQEYFWSNYLFYSAEIHRIGLFTGSAFYSIFAIYFLETKQGTPKLHNVLLIFIGLLFFGDLAVFTGFQQEITPILTSLYFLLIPITLLVAIIRLNQNYKPARFFILARTLMLLAVVLNFLTSINVIPFMDWSVNSHYLASGLESILISFALADRIKTIRIEAQIAKNNELHENLRAERAEFRAKTAELQANAAELQTQLLETEHERKTQELERARAIQLSMLPKMPPIYDGYDISMYLKTATEVGGDYYDFFLQPDGSLIIAVGDASGHGLAAGIMVTITKTALSFTDVAPMHILLDKLNKGIYAIRPERMNMAMRLLKFNKNTIVMASAGMPDVLMYSHYSNSVSFISQPSLPLGAMRRAEFSDMALPQMQKGDILVLVSDGVIEHRNEAEEQYNYDKLERILVQHAHLDADSITKKLLSDLVQFAPLNDMDDDLTYMVIKYNG